MMQLKHYFELTLTLDAEKFHKLLNRAYDKSNGELYSDDDGKYIDPALTSKGITVAYHDNSHKKKIKLTVNQGEMLNSDELDRDNISKLLRKLENQIGDYFSSKNALNDFKLNRIGIIADIDVRERRKVAAYMKVLRRIGMVKGFSPSIDSRLSNDNSFYLEGNSNGVAFMIYDLEGVAKGQLLEAEPKRKKLKSIAEKTEGILRAEVWLTKSKAIQGFSDETVASEQITDLLKDSDKIFLKTFVQIIPFGDFYKKGKAMEIIGKNVTDKTLKRKMLRLLVLVPEKKSLLLAQKALDYRRIDNVMYEFYSIGMSPVTISKRHDIKRLDNLYKYI